MKKSTVVVLLILAAAVIFIFRGCDKQVDEEAFTEAVLYYDFSIEQSENPDRNIQQFQNLWSDIQKSNMSDEELSYYEFSFYYTKINLIEKCTYDNELAYKFYIVDEYLPDIYSMSDLEKAIDMLKETLGEYNRELEYGELSYMSGIRYYNQAEYKNAAIMFTYANGYRDSDAWLEKCNSHIQ